jgi:hypothetical protein
MPNESPDQSGHGGALCLLLTRGTIQTEKRARTYGASDMMDERIQLHKKTKGGKIVSCEKKVRREERRSDLFSGG